ncbi:NAD(P)/FAD-dependent oxidoreductase [Methanocaldococcus fervens]|uniref:FAD-dependent pyridine nucleotide-disulphide oxidoreductase n=1 Tax=Methanocaldococcus fervens (strain DSM 4213 / JCM 15782 / AG86) TaxID=573064 RepID=C7P960_METFA|nr:NAD(P)/FAD-dependent oxidoreductase [Methanocaldococcus fervens]ACV25092.1 FAD-dependent pyridine nucleotide-disulphide oxidoreductase [Methanocaldococcus fervens AG86]
MDYDVVIVGAGPAGLFAAYELVEKSKLKVLVVERGNDIDDRKCPMLVTGKCLKCDTCNIMYGVGGAGGLSDGTLNLRPDIGGDLTELVNDENYAWQLVYEVDEIFLKFGAPRDIYKGDEEEVKKLEKKATQAGIKFIPIIQRHIGSDNTPKVIKNIKQYLESRGVKFMINSEVIEFKRGEVKVKTKDGIKTIKTKYIILAPGRGGAEWLHSIMDKVNLKATHAPIDVGVRVEVPALIMEHITKINHDPKFHIYTDTYDDFVRTFCTNPNGFVVKEVYDNLIGVNGHSMRGIKSKNTNFAFLVRVELTEPVEDTTSYGRNIAQIATTIGGNKPILQRLGDLLKGRRSTWSRIKRSIVEPTLKDVTPGDIAMVLPHRITTDIIEGLEKLDKIIPGVFSPNTLIYAPEIKYYAMKLEVNEHLETNIEDVFAAGDGAGLTRDIVNAAATGLIAARGILIKEGLYTDEDFKKPNNWKEIVENL